MYSNHQRTKSNECLICFKPIQQHFFLLSFIANPQICIDCFKKFNILNEEGTFDGCKIRFLYEYNDFFKSLLFQYKGQYDIALSPIFLSIYNIQFLHLYSDYVIACCPSSDKQNDLRGFAPIIEIAKNTGLPLFTGLKKIGEYKQADQPFNKRNEIYRYIDIEDGKSLYKKNVLLLDDVMTSGYTLKACLNKIREYSPNKIEILILSHRKQRKTLSSETSF